MWRPAAVGLATPWIRVQIICLKRFGLFGAYTFAVDPLRGAPHICVLMTAQPFWLRRRGDEGPVQERRKRLEL